MKKFFFLFSILSAVLLGYGVARWKAGDFSTSELSVSLIQDSKAPFVPTACPLENLPFVVVVVGRNNGAFLEKTIQSVLMQSYDRFRFVYIDDASDDGSCDLAKECIAKSKRSSLVELIHNIEEIGFIESLNRAVRDCSDQEIVVVLYGEDWLAHEWVLQRLNQYYADPDLWVTCCRSMEYPSCELSLARPVQNGMKGREAHLRISRLHTFYASLFKKILPADLLYQGQYIRGGGPAVYMAALLEMAEDHFQTLPDVLYVANEEGRLAMWEHAPFFERHIRSLPPYEKLVGLSEPDLEEL